MKETLGKKNTPRDPLHTSCPYYGTISSYNVSFPKVIHNTSSFDYFGTVCVDCSSFSLFLYVIIYNTQLNFLPILSDAANFRHILTHFTPLKL